jgi:hypothetical protein
MTLKTWQVFEGSVTRIVRTFYKPWYGPDAVVVPVKAKRRYR